MIAIIIAAAAVILDQLSKYLVVENMELYSEAPFIPHILALYRTENRGAAFSMLADSQWVFMLLSVVAMGLIAFLLIKEYRRHPLMTVSLSMILGGGIGNMIDRVRLGYVVDFFRFEFVDFAIFNVADSFITVGAVLLGVYIVFFETKTEKRISAEKAQKEADSQQDGSDPEEKQQ